MVFVSEEVAKLFLPSCQDRLLRRSRIRLRICIPDAVPFPWLSCFLRARSVVRKEKRDSRWGWFEGSSPPFLSFFDTSPQ